MTACGNPFTASSYNKCLIRARSVQIRKGADPWFHRVPPVSCCHDNNTLIVASLWHTQYLEYGSWTTYASRIAGRRRLHGRRDSEKPSDTLDEYLGNIATAWSTFPCDFHAEVDWRMCRRPKRESGRRWRPGRRAAWSRRDIIAAIVKLNDTPKHVDSMFGFESLLHVQLNTARSTCVTASTWSHRSGPYFLHVWTYRYRTITRLKSLCRASRRSTIDCNCCCQTNLTTRRIASSVYIVATPSFYYTSPNVSAITNPDLILQDQRPSRYLPFEDDKW